MQIFNFISLILFFILLFYLGSAGLSNFLARRRGTVLKANAFIEKHNEENGQLIDVREKEPFKRSHLKGARNMPSMTLSQGKSGLRKDMPIFIYGETLGSAAGVAKRLRKEGAKKDMLFLMAGGYRAFQAKQKR
ncbi:rhodanese-like domain-containing protein [Fructobacillus sp. M2-14]|uniref:Rhodanese-like domain-containing protein n=1 Tax=Fructobacillus broussonetiae TaxID=2713173 RepID=A0ABS5QYT4_9LACO|nr:rhodanese-like domain-containing protein [Fructobacillus broussonetiae]MBS9338310.1 rhodanese-like domain-containing protein [Fructobacillus broussonetiae]